MYRAALNNKIGVDVVAVNDLGKLPTMARLLSRDSVHGPLGHHVEVGEDELLVDDTPVHFFHEPQPEAIAWGDFGVDVVIESTGHFSTRAAAAGHLAGGASRVIISAPSKDADVTIVLGVNDEDFDPERHHVLSNASCTTNCLAPMIKVLEDNFGLERGFITTVHAYTGDQMLVDGPHKDARRARAAAINIVPTSTGAARATGLVLPSVQGRLDGSALRVPVADGSITDLVAIVGTDVTVEQVNEAFRVAGSGPLAGILEYSEEPLVSSDIVGNPASCVFDSGLTMTSGPLVKVYGWYDNEWGYANRLAELAALISRV
jgi:glyceraldehyde 3-phosphate dehydrogenase